MPNNYTSWNMFSDFLTGSVLPDIWRLILSYDGGYTAWVQAVNGFDTEYSVYK
jgi:hypothetical protein